MQLNAVQSTEQRPPQQGMIQHQCQMLRMRTLDYKNKLPHTPWHTHWPPHGNG